MASTTEGRPDTPAAREKGPREPSGIDPLVLGVSLSLVVVFCVAGAIWPTQIGDIGGVALTWLVSHVGWLFVLVSTGFVVFALVLAFSRYGRIPLSRNGEPPEFSTVSWVAMMFSAGMGIGLIFFGVQEPVAHFTEVPPGSGVTAGTPGAIQNSLAYTFFHWGLHPWAIYAVVALALAYSTFRMGRGNLLSSPFQSLSRSEDVSETVGGRFVNIWAIVATKFGGATSLGLGALQISFGLAVVTGISGLNSLTTSLIVIVVLVFFAILSAISGVGNGIKWLSNINMVIAALLVLFVLIVGPTVFLLDLIPQGIGAYLTNLIPLSFRDPAFGGVEWYSSWTIFYWAWWISWAPFVATFIARISRGRTIREFVLGVLVVPTVVSALWFTVLGGAGMNAQRTGQADIAGAQDEAAAFFNLLQSYPMFIVTGIVVMFLVAIFWVSGADASALVLATLSSRGKIEPKNWLVAVWAGLAAAVAAVLLYVGGLDALQTFTVIVSAPFILVMIGLCWALYVDLRRDPLRAQSASPVRQTPSPGAYATAGL
ncbi:MAG: BCCT family transporter, partial [Pseudonocardia sp.]|nr:BCCT family transporter [Pseudonocardia sp.]